MTEESNVFSVYHNLPFLKKDSKSEFELLGMYSMSGLIETFKMNPLCWIINSMEWFNESFTYAQILILSLKVSEIVGININDRDKKLQFDFLFNTGRNHQPDFNKISHIRHGDSYDFTVILSDYRLR